MANDPRVPDEVEERAREVLAQIDAPGVVLTFEYGYDDATIARASIQFSAFFPVALDVIREAPRDALATQIAMRLRAGLVEAVDHWIAERAS